MDSLVVDGELYRVDYVDNVIIMWLYVPSIK